MFYVDSRGFRLRLRRTAPLGQSPKQSKLLTLLRSDAGFSSFLVPLVGNIISFADQP
ncbi:hypothetical protein SAMD00079811_09750 [Scytonema sp. HK-05]|nr:hypothetical protein SAMD00079811_09750 [Scytonema sp. HK-05]